MPSLTITKIIKARTPREGFAVFIDDVLAFHASNDIVTRYGLHRGMEIDERTAERIASDATSDRARAVAINLISYRPRSAREVVNALTKKGFAPAVAQQVAHHLREIDLLNDLAFTRMFVRDRLRGKPMGKAMMRRKLLEKGIAFQVIERVLKEYVSEEDEQQAAERLAARKLRASRSRFAALDESKRQKRLMDYLLGRGFSTEIALKTVRTLTS